MSHQAHVLKPKYKTWVRTKPMATLVVLFLLSLGAGWALRQHLWVAVFFGVCALLFAYILFMVGAAWIRFSPRGGNYQVRLHDLIAARVRGKRILDVGCGSGHLISRIARSHPAASLVGVDAWGQDWEYSQELCVANLQVEGLAGRVEFRRADAADLPADLGLFDGIVSCLTFHEVKTAPDKNQLMAGVLQHLAPGGTFVFMDVFGDRSVYPDPARLTRAITGAGCVLQTRTPLHEWLPLPFPLRHPRVLGKVELIVGARPAAKS